MNYFRQPKNYIRLPSKGEFYPPGTLDVSENGEYAVYAMTAKDELLLKTPDALLNGSATVEVIKSCVPAIINPWAMPSIDLDAVLIAIRIATYGEEMEVSSDCPSCGALNDYNINLINYLDHATQFNYVSEISVSGLTVKIRPYTYKEVTGSALKAIEQQKIFQIVNNEEMSEEEKVEQFGKSFVKLTEMTVDIVKGCISSIVTPDDEVTDTNMISEFINNCPSETFKIISDHLTRLKEEIELKTAPVQCNECQHEFEIGITMDQTDFFGKGS